MGQKILKVVDGYGGFAKENPAQGGICNWCNDSCTCICKWWCCIAGAAIGSLKLASNTLKGDKTFPTAVANP